MGFNRSPSPGFTWRPRLNLWTDGVNNEFDATIFEARSYRHWLYLTKIGGKVVFNNYYYSSQTAYHQSHMRDLLKQLKIKIDVEVSMRCSLSKIKYESLKYVYERLYLLEIKLPRIPKAKVEGLKKDVQDCKDEIKVLRSLGAKFSKKDRADLKKNLIEADAERLKQARAERAESNKLKTTVKPKVSDLGPIDLGIFDDVSDLSEVNINSKRGVSNEFQ